MDVDIAINSMNTDCETNDYIKFNNCGLYRHCNTSIKVYRKNGRRDFQLIYIKKGCMMCNGEKIFEGNIYLYKPGECQNYSVISIDTEFYWIHFTGEIAVDLFGDTTQKVFKTGKYDLMEKFCVSAICRMATQNNISNVIVNGMLITLLGELKKFENSDMTVYNGALKVFDYINENCINEHSNEEYAKMCGLSKFYFIKQFKALCGVTPQKYRMQLVMKKASVLLLETDFLVSEISRAMGFDDTLYFSRVFKKHTGDSPVNYRKRFKHRNTPLH